jgi:hypothetical protein
MKGSIYAQEVLLPAVKSLSAELRVGRLAAIAYLDAKPS